MLCYFLPSLLTNFHIVPKDTNLYFVASRYLLPASLVLLTLSIDLKAVFGLGPKALIMFFTATASIILGGPVAILAVSAVAPDWWAAQARRGLEGHVHDCGSWIGGGANQAAMFEIFKPSARCIPAMITVDVVVARYGWPSFFWGPRKRPSR